MDPGTSEAGDRALLDAARRAGNVVFASEGDLWRVPVNGGAATRLTAYEGEEKFPAISPDGSKVTFGFARDGSAMTVSVVDQVSGVMVVDGAIARD